MVPLPLLRTTDLMKRERLLSIPEATSAEVEAAGVECRELEFDLSQAPRLRCQTADTLYVLPRNPPQEVLWWFDFLGIEKRGLALEDFIHFADEAVPFPTPCTVEDALALYCGFALPSRAELAVYAQFATDPDQRSQWLRLTTDPKQENTFAAAIRGQGWCLRGLLAALLPSVNLATADLGLLLLLLSRHHMPRAYTLASSHLQQQEQQRHGITRTACICLDRHRTPRRNPQELLNLLQHHGIRPFGSLEAIPSGVHEGLCSSYLLNLKQKVAVDESGEAPPAVLCCCRPSAFKLPSKEDRPLILVAAGTGIAPFVAFAHHLAALGGARAPVCLFYGCRDIRHFLYQDLLLSYLDPDQRQQQPPEVQQLMLQQDQQHYRQQRRPHLRVLSRIILALSRVNPERKVYVQHKVVEEGQLVWGLLRAGAAVFVCGRPAMGKAVQEALLSVAASQIGQQKAEAFIKRLHDSGLYTEELWD
ncbi:NADPH--cytochrome P450 reductase [Cyclospora cayetanensis]|uniref:NADPH--hemoprotein reductase n=1 Tax=Cyclospora cayetanensis TaxID=88456 RepID=A0A6P6RRX6_9EIME|nr:NADPH--cytochrome P450 reductase [Cyclospora cayetanensis]